MLEETETFEFSDYAIFEDAKTDENVRLYGQSLRNDSGIGIIKR